MNDQVAANQVDDELDAEADDGLPTTPADVAVQVLVDKFNDFGSVVGQVKRLLDNGHWHYVSKPQRNAILRAILDGADELDAASKAAFRGLKKVKRQRTPESVVDALVGATSFQGQETLPVK